MEFANLFKDLNVGDIWNCTKNVVCFKQDQTVSHCLKVLETEGIISAPVMNETGKIIGIVDTLDMVLFVIGLFPKDVVPQHITEAQLQDVLDTGKKFEKTPIGDVLQLSNGIHIDFSNFFPVTKNTPLEKLIDMFYLGVHRVPVVDGSIIEPIGSLQNIVSQSDLLSVLAQCMSILKKEEREQTLEQLGLARKEILAVHKKERAITVLSKMNQSVKQPVFSAVPIVDDNGKLVATFSASNVRGLHRSNFGFLLLPVMDFLDLQPKRPFSVSLTNQKSKFPIVVTPSTTFENCVMKMAATRVHRVWVVDSNQTPIGVVSIGDVFKVLLPWTK